MTENENEELKDIMVEGFPVREHTGGDPHRCSGEKTGKGR